MGLAMKKRVFAAAALLLVLCCVLAGCKSGTAPASNETTGGSVAVAQTAAPKTEPESATHLTEPTTAEPTTAVTEKPSAKKEPITVTATAAQATQAQPDATEAAERENTVIGKLMEQLGRSAQNAAAIVDYTVIPAEEKNSLAQTIADEAKIYLVVLGDGRKTYYMAVDFRTKEALALANPSVLRETCRILDENQQAMRENGQDSLELMDYTHIVGELKLHFLGYLVTDALGGENSPFAGLYNSFKVADLNVDESRVPPQIIRVFGVIYG